MEKSGTLLDMKSKEANVAQVCPQIKPSSRKKKILSVLLNAGTHVEFKESTGV